MKTFTEQPPTLAQVDSAASESFSQLASALQSRNGLILLGCFVLVGVLALWGDRKKRQAGHQSLWQRQRKRSGSQTSCKATRGS